MSAPQDEVIADSEDDQSYYPLVTSKSLSGLLDDSSVQRVGERSMESPIQTATFNSRPQPVTTDPSAISSFTPTTHIQIPRKSIAPSTISSFSPKPDASTVAPKPRPKPRPAYKGAQATSSILNESDSVGAGPSTIENTSIFNPVDTMSIEDVYGPSLADRAKMRSRNTKSTHTPSSAKASSAKPGSNTKTKSKKPKPKSVPESEIINITSSEDELAKPFPKSNSKPKPKPKPAKRTKTSPNHPAPNDSTLLLPLPDSQRTITTIPVLSSSILPPSDPPSPSTILAPTPPLANNNGMEDADLDADMSPPSSSYVGRRRKRRPAPIVPEFDFDALGLEMDVDFGGGGNATDEAEDSMLMPPPPPPFFAGSSSDCIVELDVASDAGNTIVEKPKKKKEKRKKSSKKGKKKDSDDAVVTEGGPEGGMEIEDEIRSAGTVNPKSEKKKKTKAKATKDTVDVIIQTKDKGTGAGTTKGVFKSKEFIEDDDDDDPLGMPALPPHLNPAVQDPEVSSMYDSGVDNDAGKKKDRKGKGKEKEKSKKRKTMTDDAGEDVGDMGDELRPAKKSSGKKTTRKVVSDDDDDELGGAEVIVDSSSSKHPREGKGNEDAKNSEDILDELVGEEIHKEQEIKENLRPATDLSYLNKPPPTSSMSTSSKIPSRAYSITRTKSTPMTELIRRVNSHPGSPFRTPSSSASSAYSPLLKSSRSLLSRIAPLHPTRRPPPPPPPPIPKTKERKTKKMLEMEERWEEELSESVDGWACLEEVEREGLRRRKKEMEMGGYED